ncbi:MAG: hypothetical protein PVJ39_13050 [Gammaproteobacteria bacterium]|jgi:hypothetical protein
MALLTLNDHIVQHLESGLPIQVGTRNAFNKPAYTRSWGCKVNADHHSIILFLYRSYCEQALQNIQENGVYAAAFVNVFNYETYQLKGTQAKILDDLTPYKDLLERYYQAQADMVTRLGLSPDTVDSMSGKSVDDYVPVYCPVEDCYSQTPGPGAGARVEL